MGRAPPGATDRARAFLARSRKTPRPAMTEFERLLSALIRGTAGPEDRARLLAAAPETRRRGTEALLRNILDHIADHEYHQGRESFAESCDRALNDPAIQRDDRDLPITALLALVCLNVKLLERRFQRPDPARHREADEYCRELFRRTAVRAAIHALYRPADPARFEATAWDELDPASLEYHKAGTTSFILRATTTRPADESGARRALAVKCVLFPWNKLTAIAQATDDYARVYGSAHTPPVVVHPIASTDRWVLMPFQEGRTLAELLQEAEARRPSAADRLRTCRTVAAQLTSALHELAGGTDVDPAHPRTQHLDLSPSNIILPARGDRVKLIDLGVNHLYSRQIGIAEHDDSVYIAPEVKNKGRSASSDVHSLGVILIEILCGYPPREGRAPDEIWELSPDLGRTLEDLIEEDHHHRLLLLTSGERVNLGELGDALDHAIELAQGEPGASDSPRRRRLARLLPASREVATQYRQWALSRRPDSPRVQDSYLLFFTLLATVTWWFILAKTALVKVDDLVTLELDAFPTGQELAADVIALSQGLIGAKYYQTIMARLSARRIPGRLALCAEAGIRLMAVVALLTTILAVFWRPDLWAWGCAAGAVLVAACNYLTMLLATRLHRAALRAGLSTVPPAGELRVRGFEQWWWTMLLYAVVIAIIAAGLQAGLLRDMWAYVLGLVLVSVGIHYLSKCVAAGPGVRAGLARAFAAGERMAVLAARGELRDVAWPPRR